MKSWYLPPDYNGIQIKAWTSPLIEAFIADLSVLKNVPLNVLIQDPQMLPPESIRVFYVDPDYVKSLAEGALSIGRYFEPPAGAGGNMGFLIRSANLFSFGAVETGALLKGGAVDFLRKDMFGPDILLCITKGVFDTISITQPEEARHFGFEEDDEKNLHVAMTDYDGKSLGTVSAVFREGAGDVVDVTKMAGVMAPKFSRFTSLEFAVQMSNKRAKCELGV
jgi:hypothetical protein